jgi:hypothetical protein
MILLYMSVPHPSQSQSRLYIRSLTISLLRSYVVQFNGFMSLTSYFDVKYRY